MLETNVDTILEERREEEQPIDESEEEVRVIKKAKKIETSEGNEETNEKIASFLRGKGLSENLIKKLIGTDLTDEYVRLLKAMDFDDNDIESLRDLWRIKIEVDRSVDSINSASSDSSWDARGLSPDNLYLKEVLSKPLIVALREIVARKPADPVEYLGHRLLHFKVCEERSKQRREEELELLINREKLRLQEIAGEEPLSSYERKEEEKPGEDLDYLGA